MGKRESVELVLKQLQHEWYLYYQEDLTFSFDLEGEDPDFLEEVLRAAQMKLREIRADNGIIEA